MDEEEKYALAMDFARLEVARMGLTREMVELTLHTFLLAAGMSMKHAEALIMLHTASVELERAKEGL